MRRVPPYSFAWCDDVDTLEEQLPAEPSMAGLPEHWRYYEWKMGAVLSAILWTVETWTSGAPLADTTHGNDVADILWIGLIMLTGGAGLLPLIRRRPDVAPASAS